MKYPIFIFMVTFLCLSCSNSTQTNKNITELKNDTLITLNTNYYIDIPNCTIPDEKENEPYNFKFVDIPPKFENYSNTLSKAELHQLFITGITNVIEKEFDIRIAKNEDLYGVQRIHSKFEIDSIGFVKNIKIRATHPKLEEETKRVINLLPQFIPANHNGKKVSIIYNLPITFKIED